MLKKAQAQGPKGGFGEVFKMPRHREWYLQKIPKVVKVQKKNCAFHILTIFTIAEMSVLWFGNG